MKSAVPHSESPYAAKSISVLNPAPQAFWMLTTLFAADKRGSPKVRIVVAFSGKSAGAHTSTGKFRMRIERSEIVTNFPVTASASLSNDKTKFAACEGGSGSCRI